MAVAKGRFTKGAILQNAKRIGLSPAAVIDCGFGYGTEGLDVFSEAVFLLIDPVAEVEPAMVEFCNAHPGSSYVLAAVGDEPGVAKLVARKGVTGSSFHTKLAKGEDELRDVPVVTLDAIVAERGLPKPYLLKLDLEGHELHALRGGEQTLRDTEMVIMEVSTWTDDRPKGRPSLMDLFRFMEERNFVFYEFAEPAFRPVDGALYMFDAVFVKADSVVRLQRKNKTPEQAAAARRHKEEDTKAALAALNRA